MISTNLDDFYLSAEQLASSPSRADGVSEALEGQLRRYGCDVVTEAGVLLDLPQAVACTAQVLIHRFACKRSLAAFDIKIVAMAALWLAAKLEEVIEIDNPQKLRLRDVLMVCYRVMRRRDGRPLEMLDPLSKRYDELKAEVVRGERHMLRAFGFVVHAEHSHRFVLTFGQLLGLGREVLQEGWNLANDSLRTTLCVRHRAEVVACGVLFTAARRLQVPMPEQPPWWELFGVGRAQLADVCRALAELQALPRAQYVALGRDPTSRGPEGLQSPPAAATPPSQLQSPAPQQAQPPMATTEPPPPVPPAAAAASEVPTAAAPAAAAADAQRPTNGMGVVEPGSGGGRRRHDDSRHRRSRSGERRDRRRSRSDSRDRHRRRDDGHRDRKRRSRDYSRERDRDRQRTRERSRERRGSRR